MKTLSKFMAAFELNAKSPLPPGIPDNPKITQTNEEIIQQQASSIVPIEQAFGFREEEYFYRDEF